jgi:hypothetical protein
MPSPFPRTDRALARLHALVEDAARAGARGRPAPGVVGHPGDAAPLPHDHHAEPEAQAPQRPASPADLAHHDAPLRRS